MKRSARRGWRVGALGMVSLAAWSCQDVVSPEFDLSPAFEISDARSGGNEHFFFLPPMLPALTYTGVFDGSLAPTVTISAEGEPDIELLALVDPDHELYQVNWHTSTYALDVDKTYRVSVAVDGFGLGFADVDVVASGGQLKNVQTGQYIGLMDGRTLPIKFRIEEGAVSFRWRLLAPEGAGPGEFALVGADKKLITYAPELDAAFFAQISTDYTVGTLWRFSLATHTWTEIATSNWPNGKFRQVVYDPSTNEIVLGWDGLGDVYAVPAAGGAWYLRSGGGQGQSHYTGTFFFDRVKSRLSHVFGNHVVGDLLWSVNSSGTWVSQALGTPQPQRISFCSAAVHSGRYLPMSSGSFHTYWDDLIILDLQENRWIEVIPAVFGPAVGRCPATAMIDDDLEEIYRFGGHKADPPYPMTDDFQRLVSDGAGTYSWAPVETVGDRPDARTMAGMFFDASRGDLVLVGGVKDTALSGTSPWKVDVWAIKVR